MTDAETGTPEDLAPRPPRPPRTGARRWLPLLVGLGVSVAVVGLVWNLVEGALFLYDADEAVERRAELADERFTLTGAPIGCSILKDAFDTDGEPVVVFSMSFGGKAIDIVHRGDPAELFLAGVPVVLDGAWVESSPPVDGYTGLADDGWHYASDRMRVKHDQISKTDDDRPDVSATEAASAAEACQT